MKKSYSTRRKHIVGCETSQHELLEHDNIGEVIPTVMATCSCKTHADFLANALNLLSERQLDQARRQLFQPETADDRA